VAVCGGGDAGVTEALYLAKLGSKVTLVEFMPRLTASAILQDRAKGKMEVHTGTKVETIIGKDKVEAVECVEIATGLKKTLQVEGVLVHVGLDPNTEYLEGTVPLDKAGQVIVDARMQSEVPYVLACGDIRSGSVRQISAAVGDGAVAGITAQRLLQEMD
jgi:thioredoxin reductase (NADPH)